MMTQQKPLSAPPSYVGQLFVKRGIRWLNNHHPGWLQKIDPESIDIASNADCIIGQLFGSYMLYSLKAGKNKKTFFETHGFTPSLFRSSEQLTYAWKTAIETLREEQQEFMESMKTAISEKPAAPEIR